MRYNQREKIRETMPYGKWICEDGREVLFNRRYNPIWERKNGIVKKSNPEEWIENIIETSHYYKDTNSPVRNKETMKKCLDILNEWDIERD